MCLCALCGPGYGACGKRTPSHDYRAEVKGARVRDVTEQPHAQVSCVKQDPVLFHKPGTPTAPRDAEPTGYCLPVSVLGGQVLLHAFHQVPEALGKALLLGERLAVDQARPQFAEILLGDRAGVRLRLRAGERPGEGAGPAPSCPGSRVAGEHLPAQPAL